MKFIINLFLLLTSSLFAQDCNLISIKVDDTNKINGELIAKGIVICNRTPNLYVKTPCV